MTYYALFRRRYGHSLDRDISKAGNYKNSTNGKQSVTHQIYSYLYSIYKFRRVPHRRRSSCKFSDNGSEIIEALLSFECKADKLSLIVLSYER